MFFFKQETNVSNILPFILYTSEYLVKNKNQYVFLRPNYKKYEFTLRILIFLMEMGLYHSIHSNKINTKMINTQKILSLIYCELY